MLVTTKENEICFLESFFSDSLLDILEFERQETSETGFEIGGDEMATVH